MKFYLRRVYLDKQGYANKGRYYFGVGNPWYYHESSDGKYHGYFRANNRGHAKFLITQLHKNARFYN